MDGWPSHSCFSAFSVSAFFAQPEISQYSFAAIAITLWCAGTGPGLLALLLSYLALNNVYVPVRLPGSSSESYLVIYAIFGGAVAWFSSFRRRAERLLTEARDNLEVRVA